MSIQTWVEVNRSSRSLGSLFRSVIFQFMLALTLAVAIQAVDPYLARVYAAFNLNVPPEEDYFTLLSAIGGIAGLFIGLYYAALATVGATIYARVPNNIRDLLVNDRQGIVYMRFLSFLTFLCLILIAFRLLGLERVLLAIILSTGAAGFGILAFVQLGRRAFYLFDPTQLSNQIHEVLIDAIAMVSVGGHRWRDPSFQYHAHRKAVLALSDLETLADLTIQEPHLNEKSFIALSNNILRLLIYYERTKRKIPTSSRWYAQRYEHRDWYRTDDSRIAIAHHTGTSIDPDVVSDFTWFEGKLYPILLKCIQTNTESMHYGSVQELVQYLSAYAEQLAKEGRLPQAFSFLEEVGTPIIETLCRHSPKAGERPAYYLPLLALTENIATLPIAAALGAVKITRQLDRARVSAFVDGRWWQRPSSIYLNDLPAYLLPRLEWLADRMRFEDSTLGRVVSPGWYQTELILQVAAEEHKSNLDTMQSKGASLFHSWLKTAVESNDMWFSAAITRREWEYLHKVQANLGSLLDVWDAMSSERKLQKLAWPDLDGDAIRAKIKSDMEEVVRRMATQSLLLARLSRPAEFPDYSGQFLHTVGENIFNAVLENRSDFLAATFSAYLDGVVQRYQELRPKVASDDYWTRQVFRTAGAALLDVMDVSGYVRLLAEVHGNAALWQTVATAWEKYLGPSSGDNTMGQLLVGVVSMQEGTLEIPHRGVLRTTWHGHIEHVLRQLPRKEIRTGSWMNQRTEIDHSSPLVRAFAGDGDFMHYSGEHLFVNYLLDKYPDLEAGDLGWKVSELRRELQEYADGEASVLEPSDE